jgi:hypothetical protein
VLNVDLLDALLPPTGEPRHSEYGTDAFWRRVDTYAARLHGASRPSVGCADGDAAIERQRAPLAGQRGDGGVSPANGPAMGGAHCSTARFALLGRAIAELDALADGVRCAELKVRCAAPLPRRVYQTRRFVALRITGNLSAYPPLPLRLRLGANVMRRLGWQAGPVEVS